MTVDCNPSRRDGWTKHNLEVLHREWPGDRNRDEIAEMLGRTVDACRKKATKLGLGNHRIPTTWDAHGLVESLKQLWASSHSASQIAAKLGGGITRMAVLGKLHRLGLLGSTEINRQKAERRRQTTKSNPKPRPYPSRRGQLARVSVYPSSTVPAPSSLNHLITDTTGCRFIAGEDRLCCGHPRLGETSWCEAHYRACHARYQTA